MAFDFMNMFAPGGTPSGLDALLSADQRKLMGRNANLSAAAALLAASGPSRQRVGLGQALGSALQAGQQGYQQARAGSLQEMLLGEKMREGQTARTRQADIERIIGTGIRPAVAGMPAQMVEEEGRFLGETPAVAARPAGFDIQAIAPQLMVQGPEGRKAFGDLLAAQKTLMGDTFSLAEGAKQFQRDPITGVVTEIAAGAPKREAVPADIQAYNLAKDQGFKGSFVEFKNSLTAPPSDIQAYNLAKSEGFAGSFVDFKNSLTAPPSDIQGFNLAKQQGYKGNFIQYQNAVRPPSSTTINMPGEGERKAAVLANRLNFSVGQMNSAISTDPSAAMPKTSSEVARFLTKTEFLPNALNSEQRQIVEAAQMDVLDAALTLGTGAAYTIPQLESYRKSYFPQIGDSKETVKSKQDRLMNLLKSAELASGRAADQISAPIPKPVDFSKQQTPQGVPKFDPEKETRYQEWLKSQRGR
jgi:hypothetical protein